MNNTVAELIKLAGFGKGLRAVFRDLGTIFERNASKMQGMRAMHAAGGEAAHAVHALEEIPIDYGRHVEALRNELADITKSHYALSGKVKAEAGAAELNNEWIADQFSKANKNIENHALRLSNSEESLKAMHARGADIAHHFEAFKKLKAGHETLRKTVEAQKKFIKDLSESNMTNFASHSEDIGQLANGLKYVHDKHAKALKLFEESLAGKASHADVRAAVDSASEAMKRHADAIGSRVTNVEEVLGGKASIGHLNQVAGSLSDQIKGVEKQTGDALAAQSGRITDVDRASRERAVKLYLKHRRLREELAGLHAVVKNNKAMTDNRIGILSSHVGNVEDRARIAFEVVSGKFKEQRKLINALKTHIDSQAVLNPAYADGISKKLKAFEAVHAAHESAIDALQRQPVVHPGVLDKQFRTLRAVQVEHSKFLNELSREAKLPGPRGPRGFNGLDGLPGQSGKDGVGSIIAGSASGKDSGMSTAAALGIGGLGAGGLGYVAYKDGLFSGDKKRRHAVN